MKRRSATKSVIATIAATVALTGCATIQRSQARDTEELLAAAGFTMQLPDAADATPADATTPYRLVKHIKDGTVQYRYADPGNCRCVYVGGAKEYGEYEHLASDRGIAQERLWEAQNAWGPYYWGGPEWAW
jgi:hypothetical protein